MNATIASFDKPIERMKNMVPAYSHFTSVSTNTCTNSTFQVLTLKFLSSSLLLSDNNGLPNPFSACSDTAADCKPQKIWQNQKSVLQDSLAM
jgi:hypothetical protein